MKTQPKQKAATPSSEVEGEGSYTATRRYNAGVAASVEKGKAAELAKKAKQALAGPEGQSLLEAERVGKSGHPKKGGSSEGEAAKKTGRDGNR